MSKKYLVTENNGANNHAGSKARNDIEDILFKKEYINLKIQKHYKSETVWDKIKIIFKSTIDWIGIFNNIEKDSSVIIQYPLESPKKLINFYLKIIKLVKNVKFIALIHDLESLRFTRKSDKFEMKFLKQYNSIICHNKNMKNYLIENGINKENIVCLEIFDYLIEEEKNILDRVNKKEVIIAGNLSEKKSPYVYLLNDVRGEVKFNLFGPNFKEYISENIEYLGQYPPERLPNILKGSYGLVWDGSSIDTCDGITGRYLKYNNPHKLSLYIASKLPIIIWKKSAMANFVEEENIGVTINSLNEIDSVLGSISSEHYKEMLINLEKLSIKLNDGYYLKNAIKNINL